MFRFITFCIAIFFVSIFLFVVFLVTWIFTVPFDNKQRRAIHKISQFWSYVIFKLHPKWKIDIIGREHIVPGQNYVILSNHQAVFDIPLIMHLGLNVRWVSKHQILRMPLVGILLLMRGDVTIRRGAVSSAKKMIKDCTKFIKNGLSIAMFPEGARTLTGQIAPFQSGAFLLAARAHCPILPIAIDGNYDVFNFKNPRRRVFTITIAPPLMPEEINKYTMEELRDKTEEIIKNKFNTICQKN